MDYEVQSTQMTSTAFAEFLAERGVKHILCSVYWPQANGDVERWNRVLKDCIQVAEMQQQASGHRFPPKLQSDTTRNHRSVTIRTVKREEDAH